MTKMSFYQTVKRCLLRLFIAAGMILLLMLLWDIPVLGASVEIVSPTLDGDTIWVSDQTQIEIRFKINTSSSETVEQVLYSVGSINDPQEYDAGTPVDGIYTISFSVNSLQTVQLKIGIDLAGVPGGANYGNNIYYFSLDNAIPQISLAEGSYAYSADSGIQIYEGDYVKSATITLQASDSQSGISGIYYKIGENGTEQALSGNSLTVSEPTDQLYYFYAKDGAGQRSDFLKVKVNIDNKGPVATATDSPPDTWLSGDSYTFKGTVRDEGSGVAPEFHCNCDFDYASGGTLKDNGDGTYSYEHTIHFGTAGDGRVTFVFYDKLGNYTPFPYRLKIDPVAPIIQRLDSYSSSWTNTDITLRFDITDENGSGIANVYYTIGNNATKHPLYRNPATQSFGNGTYELIITEDIEAVYTFYAVDAVGHYSSVSVDVKLDKTAPVISHGATESGISIMPIPYQNIRQIKLVGKATESGSGMKLTVRQGNSESAVDEVPLVWTNEAEGYYSVTIDFASDYKDAFYLIFSDNAGNTTTIQAFSTLYIDTQMPEIIVSPADLDRGWRNADFTLTLRAEDGDIGSDIQSVSYSLNANLSDAEKATKQPDGAYTLTIPCAAGHMLDGTLYLWATDMASNTSEGTPVAVTVKIDKILPTLTVEGPELIWQQESTFSLTVSVTDGEAGVKGFRHSFTNDPAGATPVTFTGTESGYQLTIPDIARDGMTPYYIWAEDAAGNLSEVKSVSLNKDTSLPVHVPASDQATVSQNGTILMEGTIADIIAGLDTAGCFARICYGEAIHAELILNYAKNYNYFDRQSTPPMLGPPFDSQWSGKVFSAICGANGDGSIDYSIPLTFETDFSGDYVFIFMDMAGNYIEYRITLHVDKTKPVIGTINNDSAGEWTNQDVRFSFSVQDISPIEVSYYRSDKTGSTISLTPESQVKDETSGLVTYTYSFVISPEANQSFVGSYVILAVDAAYNESEKSSAVKFDTVVPVVEEVSATLNDAGWSNGDVTVTVKASDADSGGVRIYYTTGTNGARKEAMFANGCYTFLLSGDQEQEYFIWAEDKVSNASAKETQTIRIDSVAPVVSDYAFDGADIRYFTFGTFSREGITVTASTADSAGAIHSGIADIVLTLKPAEGASTVVKYTENTFIASGITASASFPVPLGFSGTVYAVITDKAGNVSEGMVIANNNNTQHVLAEDGYIAIENQAPAITITPSGNGMHEDWFGGDISFSVELSDKSTDGSMAASGLGAVTVTILTPNGITKTMTQQTHPTLTWENVLTVSTAELEAGENPDGKYVLTTELFDNAGNSVTASITVYKDTTAPSLSDFSIGSTSQKTFTSPGTTFTFTRFFSETITCTVTAVDVGPSAGIAYFTVYAESFDGTILYLDESGKFNSVSKDAIRQNPEKYAIRVNADASVSSAVSHTISFTLSSAFKGRICIMAADKVGNGSDFQSPYDLIIENETAHDTAEHITATLPATAFRDVNYGTDGSVIAAGLPLYNGDIALALTISDTFSGIQSVNWSISYPDSPAETESGSYTVSGGAQYGQGGSFQVTDTSANLITELTGTITCTGNSNDIEVTILVTDNCGNTSTHTVYFSIDKTKPTIELSFENEEADSEYSGFFRREMVLNVVIRERNFDASAVKVTITNTDGTIPVISAFVTRWSSSPDNTTHTATIRFAADGDYTVKISYADLAENQAEDAILTPFTIDRTLPAVLVTYDNNDSRNEMYYKEARTATITITEHNFDPARVSVQGVTQSGALYPLLSEWVSTGDIHVATILYDTDDVYSFSISLTDKAGNRSAAYQKETFCIDLIAPVVTFTGIEDGTHYNGSLSPAVTCTDGNFDSEAIGLQLIGILNGTVELAQTNDTIDDGMHFAFHNFEAEKGADDAYTLTVSVTDLAGNTTTLVIRFCINRNGSVYKIEDSEKYLSEGEALVVQEYNLSELVYENIIVRLNKNGYITELHLGTDYAISVEQDASGFYLYRYTIASAVFRENGVYRVIIRSKDISGNLSETTMEQKNGDIAFMVDMTAPILTLGNLESEQALHSNAYTVSMSVSDNLRLASVSVYDGDTLLESWTGSALDTDFGIFRFVLESMPKERDIRIVATDLSGNQTEVICANVLVTTNLFIRLINNLPLTISLAVLLLLAIAALIWWRLRKRDLRTPETESVITKR